MHKVESDKDSGHWVDPNRGKKALNEFADKWLQTRSDKARSTTDRDKSYLNSMIRPHFGDRAVASIRPSDIKIWVANLDQAPSTRSKALQIIDAVLELAREDAAIAANPAADVKRPTASPRREGIALNDLQLQSVIEAAEVIDPSTAPMVQLMARCGLRVGEAIALRWENVDLDGRAITLSESMSRNEGIRPLKGRDLGEERCIPIPRDVEDRLHRHMSRGHDARGGAGLLFTSPDGHVIRYSNWRRRVWTKIVAASGVDCVPHDLRRTTATRLFLRDGWSPPEVQAYLGHRDPRMTLKVYTRINSSSLPQPSSL